MRKSGGGKYGGRGPASALTSKIYWKSIANSCLSMHHSSFAGYKFRADSEQASFYASSNRMMSRGRLKNHPDIIMWGEACIINKSFLYKARWHRRSVSNPSPILLQSFSDPSPILLQSFSNPSPILLQSPPILLKSSSTHVIKTQKRPNTETQGVENFR